MEYKRFLELIDKGESKSIDYKILCNAFTKGNEKDTAELVKDIIALSNNGNIASYLIIGVSDDRTGFRTVDNNKLTDDNIQNLCRDYIFPTPRVKLRRCCWSDVTDEKHRDKEFIIIQVGPQARQCFRFNRDFINYDKKYCFRKNEVWIRREATSDLALPEEIKRLLEGKEPIANTTLESNNEYKRLPKKDFKGTVANDLKEFIESINAKLKKEATQFGSRYDGVIWDLVNININENNLKIVVIIVDKCTGRGGLAEICRRIPIFHHGVLLISLGNVTSSAVEFNNLRIKESWGWFCTNYNTTIGRIINKLPTNKENFSLGMNETFCVALDKVVDTQTLHNKLVKAIECLTLKNDIKSYLEFINENINECLYTWKLEGFPYKTDRTLSNNQLKKVSEGQTINSLKKNEFIDFNKYGNKIMQRLVKMDKIIERFLDEI